MEKGGALGAAVLGLCAALATPASAHPTPAETAELERAQALCVQEVPERLDPVRLGQSTEDLEAAFGDALRADGDTAPPQRLSRSLADADVVAIDYDLHDGRIFRIRWRLAERFEVPVMDRLLVQGRACLGEPAYDQTLEPKPGRARPVIRRIGWNHGGKRVELRQVHPLTGGPTYLSVADRAALDAALKDPRTPLAEPEGTSPWWQRPQVPEIPEDAERRALAEAFAFLLSQLDH